MGEMADDLVEGWTCSLCGCCFETEHGYPVVCKECWADLTPEDRKQYQRATQDTL